MSNEKNQPFKKVKNGKISVSIWRRIAKKDGIEVEIERACVQKSVLQQDTGEWQNQQIWLNVEELRDLSIALVKLNEEGDDTPSSNIQIHYSSQKAHRIIEYIKANSLDAGLDVFDLQEMSPLEVLSHYDIYVKLTPEEEKLIIKSLMSLIEQQEFREITYNTQRCHEPLFD